MDELKSTISNNFIFSVDETTDVCGRYIANLIIGILHEESPTKAFLIASKELEKTNSNTVIKFVHDELTKFFLPNPVPSEKILLMVSDAAAYMIKAASNLKIFYTNFNSFYMPSSWFKSGCGNYSIAVSFNEHFNFTR
jgi:hypothetical protein